MDLDTIAAKYGGMPAQAAPSGNLDAIAAKYGGSAQAGTQGATGGNNLIQSIITDPIKTLLVKPAFRTVQAAASAIGAGMSALHVGGDIGDRLQAAAQQPMSMPLPFGMGTVNVEGQRDIDKGGAGQIANQALQSASYLVPGEAAAGAGESLFSGALARAAGGGALAGAQFGALSGAGNAFNEDNNYDPNLGDIAGQATLGGLAGAAGGSLLGLGGAAAMKGLRGGGSLLSDLFTKGVDQTAQDAARATIESGFRDTAQKYVAPSRALSDMESRGNDPVGVLSSYGGGQTIPSMENGKIDPTEPVEFLKNQISELSKIKNDAVSVSNSYVPVEDFRGAANEQIQSQNWSAVKKQAVTEQVGAILDKIEGAYKNTIPLEDVDKIKTEETALSKSYNNQGRSAFEYDAHAIVGKAARTTVETVTNDAPTKQLNKLISSHYDAIDLLESMRGKTPRGGMLSKHFSRLAGEMVGGITGSTVGHPLIGAFIGERSASMIDGILGNDFISSPLKRMLIKNMDDVPPEVVQKVLDYIKKTAGENASRLRLPAPGQTTKSPIMVYPKEGGQMEYTGKENAVIPSSRASGQRLEEESSSIPRKNMATNPSSNIIGPNDTTNGQSGKVGLSTLLGGAIGGGGAIAANIPSAPVSYKAAQSTPAQAIPKVDPDKLAESIKKNETGIVKKPYSFSQPSGVKALGRALGAYQITEAELKTYAQRFLGKAVSAREFLASPDVQDAYMKGKIEALSARGLSAPEIMAVHNKGMSDLTPEGLTTSTQKAAGYVKKGMRTYEDLISR